MKSPSTKNSRDLTTGQVAKMLRCSQQTVIRQFDNGSLKGYRCPGSRFRRIPLESVHAYMRENNIPIKTDLDKGILVVDQSQGLAASLQSREVKVRRASSIPTALIWVGKHNPSQILVNLCTVPVRAAIHFAETVQKECQGIRLLCTCPQGISATGSLSIYECIQWQDPHRTSLKVISVLEGGAEC